MNTVPEEVKINVEPLPLYHRILLAVDSSDHANRGVSDGIEIAGLSGASVTAAHVYAAQMHDMRFRQMEGGLPEKYREEQELERQRDVHDDLITRGLSIIADSYMDPVDRACKAEGLKFIRRSLEGKNYREMVAEANSGNHDLLVLGALGLGAVAGSRVGTVCERVVRRSGIDTLVIKSPAQSISEGPIVAAIDGSPKSYGGLLTALSLAQEWQLPLHVVSAYDPYYHYVAFNRIADGLSEEAGKVFRFQEQEKLHEEIIDSGLAKIYAGHLQIAQDIAADYGIPVKTQLLDGKAYDAIERCLRELQPSLLVIGKLGIHADSELDIGGNAENLLRNAPCAVLLSQREFKPQIERIADVTVSWTNEAQNRLQRAPSFVQSMARMAILRYAQERGHTVITERIVEEATAALMPGRADQMMSGIIAAYDAGETESATEPPALTWSDDATGLLCSVDDPSVRDNLRLRAEKKARADNAIEVSVAHVEAFLADVKRGSDHDSEARSLDAEDALYWETDALARLARVPEGFMRDASRQRIEDHARRQGAGSVTLELVEQGLDQARDRMAARITGDADAETEARAAGSKCPFAKMAGSQRSLEANDNPIQWSARAMARLQEVPEGYCRGLTKRAVETLAGQNDLQRIDVDFLSGVLKVFKQGSQSVKPSMPWTEAARDRIARAPDSVRGMLQKEIEAWAKDHGLEQVDERAVRAIKREWQSRGVFHLEPGDPRGGA